MSSKNCLIDVRPLLEPRRAGVGQVAFHLTQELIRQSRAANDGWSFKLFGHAWNQPWPEDLPKEDTEKVAYSSLKLPSKLLNLSVGLAGRPRLEEMAGDFQAAWLPNLNFAASRRPYVVTAHDLSFVRFPEFFSGKQRLWHAAIRPKRLLTGAAKVMAVSEHTKLDLMETYGIAEERIEVIHPAAGPEYRPASDGQVAKARKKYDLPKRFFLFLGTIEPRKNIDGLISAFEQLDTEAELVIAGGKGWLWKGVFRQAARSPAGSRIRFLDYVDEADKPALYSAARAFVYPSFYEGFGLPPLEAMACGCPVVSSYASSLGEVVGQAGLLVDPHDLAELTEAMRLLLEDEGLRNDLKTDGRKRAEQFSWQTAARKLGIIINAIGA